MITLLTTELATLFLIVMRISPLIFFSPIEVIRQLPVHIRFIMNIGLSSILMNQLAFPRQNIYESEFVISALIELSNGLVLSTILHGVFAVFHIAGHFIDTQMGLNSMAILNPSANTQDSLLGRLFMMLGTLFFFASNGHHRLIQGLIISFKIIPLGNSLFLKGIFPTLEQFSFMFFWACIISSPIVIGLLLVDSGSALLARQMPQLSPYFITVPIKVFLGLFLFILTLRYVNPLLERLFQSYFESWMTTKI